MFSSYFFTGNTEVRVSCLKLKTMIEFQEEMGWGRAKSWTAPRTIKELIARQEFLSISVLFPSTAEE